MTYLQIRISMVLLLVEIQYMKYFSFRNNAILIISSLILSFAIDEIGLE